MYFQWATVLLQFLYIMLIYTKYSSCIFIKSCIILFTALFRCIYVLSQAHDWSKWFWSKIFTWTQAYNLIYFIVTGRLSRLSLFQYYIMWCMQCQISILTVHFWVLTMPYLWSPSGPDEARSVFRKQPLKHIRHNPSNTSVPVGDHWRNRPKKRAFHQSCRILQWWKKLVQSGHEFCLLQLAI